MLRSPGACSGIMGTGIVSMWNQELGLKATLGCGVAIIVSAAGCGQAVSNSLGSSGGVAGGGHTASNGGMSGSGVGGTMSMNDGTGGETGAGGVTSCDVPALKDKTRPGYTEPQDPRVRSVLATMPLASKIRQMTALSPATRDSATYRDTMRQLDADDGQGSVVRGTKYRYGSRGVNLVDGQVDRISKGENFSTVFPVESVRAASFDVDLEYRVGEAIGEETMTSLNTVLLAPALTMLRHPFAGRSQETYGEDVFLVGRMGAAFVAGAQQHVIACATQFGENGVENNRSNVDSIMDEQTLREVYTHQYGMAVTDGGAGCVMTGYHLVNGVKSAINAQLLKDVLRTDVGFRGFAVNDRFSMPGDQRQQDLQTGEDVAARALQAGLDVESSFTTNYVYLPDMVSSQVIGEDALNAPVSRTLEQKFRFGNQDTMGPFGRGASTTQLSGDSIVGNDDHLALAEEAELKSAVLLTNGLDQVPVLPLRSGGKLAVLGLDLRVAISTQTTPPVTGTTLHFSTDSNLGDRGSSLVNADPAKTVGPFAGIQVAASEHGISDVISGSSADAAAGADSIVVVVGLSAADEGEEFSLDSHGDRTSLALPNEQADFVNQVLAAGKPTVVIVESGSVVDLPWLSHANKSQATIWAGYSGQRGGSAYGKLLFGDSNFSGKLPFTWAEAVDLPAFRDAQPPSTWGGPVHVSYFFGYRDYDQKKAQGAQANPVFPFGHGLSYTHFTYSNLQMPCAEAFETNGVADITVDITNTGSVAGSEAALLFIAGPPKSDGITGNRPVKELKSFTKIDIPAGATQRAHLSLRLNDLRHWEGDASGHWIVDPGVYTVMVGASADDADLSLTTTFSLTK